ncbi:BON domain-containing protein [Novosphingobium acidiphilum]|uniref:BON domain-containing protein n=1 Tax=Novosphingobium acidiphilum TaxID=505248 RepID=UPI000429DBC4|nr:BON domain-containing protein [Novosphingobium acidiphilum]
MSADRQLQEAVLAEFLWEPSVNAAHIGVTASQGIVTLTGIAPDYLSKIAAERAAMRVRGVKAVVLDVTVVLPDTTNADDQAIARAALDRLAWEINVPGDVIQVEVEHGWITLTGTVEWYFQKDAAQSAVHGLRGVIGVTNQIVLKPHVNLRDISHDIGKALHRSWFDPSTIKVTADGGKVTLRGTVHTLADKWKASTTAWGSPGITEIENDLVVVD